MVLIIVLSTRLARTGIFAIGAVMPFVITRFKPLHSGTRAAAR